LAIPIRDYERKTGAAVTLNAPSRPVATSLPIQITMYRLLQESLSNGFRHAGGLGQHVEIKAAAGRLTGEVSDRGAGFDTSVTVPDGHMGLAGMRERVEILGGAFELQSTPHQGTTIRVMFPLVVQGLRMSKTS
jgi:signal transduction histidine kinase